ncbi:hypothetical protein GCM10009113_25050 [Marinobacter szutsaonensis]
MNGLTMDVFRSGRFSKATSAFTALMFTFVFYLSPNGKAVADEINKENARQAKIERILENTPEKKLAHRLEKLKQKLVKDLPEAVAKRQNEKGWMGQALDAVGLGDMPLRDNEVNELEKLKEGIERAYDEAIISFEKEGERLSKRRNLPAGVKDLVRQRHTAAVDRVKEQYGNVMTKLDQIVTTQDPEEQQKLLEELSDSLGKQQFKRSHTAEDPNQLPWRAPSDKVREPKTNKRNLQAALGIDPYREYVQFASTEPTADMLVAAALAQEKGVTDADLAETIDIQITDEIKELAASLNNNPVEIYTWVHNNIRFVPSYGSIQGSQYTLETKRGNAIDTASLLIALLRAAGIPAKYAYGTVEIPVDQVMNWVGGVTAPEAAQSLLGQGGIPNTALIEGGKITKIRMEHTWVEAFVDFEPSRGIKNRAGDNWIPMDASFKQYEFTESMNLKEAVPFDTQALSNSVEQSAEVDADKGWVKGIPQADLESALLQYQEQMADYIDSQNPDATVGEVLGLQEIDILPPRPLSAGLPYAHIVTQDSFAEVPDNLRHRFKYELATQSYGYPNAPLIVLNEPTVKLAGKKLAVGFSPASAEDQALIESYLSNPDTGEIDPANLPNTLPGYLINLKAELSIDGEVIQQAPAQTMGAELHETLGLYSPSHNWFTSKNSPIAGEHRAIGLDLQGMSSKQVNDLRNNIEDTKSKLWSPDDQDLADLSRQDVMGDILHATIFSYFALNDLQEEIQANNANMVTHRLPSYGIFSTTIQPRYWFGLPRDVNLGGFTIDVDSVTFHGVAKDNNDNARTNFIKTSGIQWSAMEHLVPEQIFSTSSSPASGISAVKALELANAQGQRIWTIDNSNLDQALAQINLSDEVETEIRNSVLAGNIATTHEYPITLGNWIGSGYLLLDPETGAGAYKIAGGANGGFLDALAEIFEWLGYGFAWKEFLAILGSAKSIAEIFSKIGSFLFAFAFGLSVYDLATNCANAAAAQAFILIYTVVTIMVLALLFAFAGPIGTIVGMTLLGLALNQMNSLLKSSPLCRQ